MKVKYFRYLDEEKKVLTVIHCNESGESKSPEESYEDSLYCEVSNDNYKLGVSVAICSNAMERNIQGKKNLQSIVMRLETAYHDIIITKESIEDLLTHIEGEPVFHYFLGISEQSIIKSRIENINSYFNVFKR